MQKIDTENGIVVVINLTMWFAGGMWKCLELLTIEVA